MKRCWTSKGIAAKLLRAACRGGRGERRWSGTHANAKQTQSTHGDEEQRKAESYLQTADSLRCFHAKYLRLDCHNLCL